MDKVRRKPAKLGEYDLEGGAFTAAPRPVCVTSGTRRPGNQCARTLWRLGVVGTLRESGLGLREVLRRIRSLTES